MLPEDHGWQQAQDECKRLRSLLSALRWRSVDKDNMEFECRVSCYEMDAIREALTEKE